MEPTWSPVLSVGWGEPWAGPREQAPPCGSVPWGRWRARPLPPYAPAMARPPGGSGSSRGGPRPSGPQEMRTGRGQLQEFWPLAPSTRGHPPPCSGLAGICVRLEFLRNKPCNSSSAQEPAIAPYGSRPQQTLGGHLMLGKKRLQVPGPSAAGSAVQLQTLPVFYSAEGG